MERAVRPLSDAARVGHLPPLRRPRCAMPRSGSLREMLPASRRQQRAGRPFHPNRARFSFPGVAAKVHDRREGAGLPRLGKKARALTRAATTKL